MPLPSLAIVGRPNVGKSTLFNSLVGERVAIEASLAGTTRDRVLHTVTVDDRSFDLVDTGGIGIVDRQKLEDLVERQIAAAIAAASALLFLVDARDGITPLDEEVARRLRRAGKPVLLAANKCDTPGIEAALPSFHALGFGDALPVSSKHRRNLDDLEQAILRLLPETEAPESEPDLLKIAFIGRRNVGKSTIVNALCGEERVIVSDVPGTTRDTLDIRIEREGRAFLAIDTAGLRKPGQMDDMAEFFGHVRTERAMRRADVVILMLDATDEVSRVDKRIGSLLVEECKPCLIALNKWDLALERDPRVTVAGFEAYIADRLPGLGNCRLAGVSAKTGLNLWPLIDAAHELAEQARRRVGTGALNIAINEAQKKRRPRPRHGKCGRIHYGTQIDVAPPSFLLFCNDPGLFDEQYQRYMQGELREALGFDDVPLRFLFRSSPDKERRRKALTEGED